MQKHDTRVQRRVSTWKISSKQLLPSGLFIAYTFFFFVFSFFIIIHLSEMTDTAKGKEAAFLQSGQGFFI